MTIATLITTADNITVVRDAIAAILKAESIAQMALADAVPTDSTPWDLRVFTERVNPWEQWLAQGNTDERPIVNVSIETSQVDESMSDPIRRQVYDCRFAVDVYGRGVASTDGGAGHVPADLSAANNRDRGAKLVRQFLAASNNAQLLSRDVVHGGVLVTAGEYFLPTVEDRFTPGIRAVRYTVTCRINEYSPQEIDTADTLELLSFDFTRSDDGELLAEADIDCTPDP